MPESFDASRSWARRWECRRRGRPFAGRARLSSMADSTARSRLPGGPRPWSDDARVSTSPARPQAAGEGGGAWRP
eukprot:7591450-Heterocapsa_arctica.AAC.1